MAGHKWASIERFDQKKIPQKKLRNSKFLRLKISPNLTFSSLSIYISHLLSYWDQRYRKSNTNIAFVQSSLGLRGFPLRGFWLRGFLRLHKKICITRFYSIKFQRYANFFDNFFCYTLTCITRISLYAVFRLPLLPR